MSAPPSSPPTAQALGLLPAFDSTKTRLFLKPKKTHIETFLPSPIPTSENISALHSNVDAPSSPLLSSPVRLNNTSSNLDLHYKLVLPRDGTPVLVGRSSKSCDFNLRANNKQVSRVHFKIMYNNTDQIVSAECYGWNGFQLKLKSSNFCYEVCKGQVINFDLSEPAELNVQNEIIDIEIDRAPLAKKIKRDETASVTAPFRRPSVPTIASLETQATPVNASPIDTTSNELNLQNNTKATADTESVATMTSVSANNIPATTNSAQAENHTQSQMNTSSNMASNISQPSNEQSDAVILPLTANEPTAEVRVTDELLPKNAKTVQQSLKRHSDNIKSEEVATPKRRALSPSDLDDVRNIVCNFIAYSRLSAVPFKSIRKANVTLSSLTKHQLLDILANIDCIGQISIVEEDKRRDFEYYYIPEKDDDEQRRATVINTRGHRSLRSCRKTHKQYLYKPLQLD